MPLATCVEEIGLTEQHWISPLHYTPLRRQDAQCSHLDPYKYVIVKLGKEEAKASGWEGWLLPDRPQPEASHGTAGRADEALGAGVVAVRRHVAEGDPAPARHRH